MSDIYKCAKNVVNWLGPETSNTAIGIEILEFLFSAADITFLPSWERYRAQVVRNGLNEILKRDYFQRIWVVQENALALEIILQAGSRMLT